MNSKPQLSPSSVIFLAKFKNFLESMGMTITEFLQNFRTINHDQLSRR